MSTTIFKNVAEKQRKNRLVGGLFSLGGVRVQSITESRPKA